MPKELDDSNWPYCNNHLKMAISISYDRRKQYFFPLQNDLFSHIIYLPMTAVKSRPMYD